MDRVLAYGRPADSERSETAELEFAPLYGGDFADEAWIIGNGPSLAKIDLNLLCDRVTYGMQRIHLMYDKFRWRPTYYFMYDRSRPRQPQQWKEDLAFHSQQGYPCYIRADFAVDLWEKFDKTKINFDNVVFVPCCEHVQGNDHVDAPGKPTEWHLPVICKYGGSAFAAIQMAVMRGARRIFLLGCDLGYGDAATVNHFSRDYLPPDSYDIRMARVTNRTMEDAHRIAKMECNKRGIQLINATPGGHLNVHPRRDFQKCLNGLR